MSDQNQFGGRLLSQGLQGCVFVPKLKCLGNSQRKSHANDFIRASQLMVDKLTSRNEGEQEFVIANKILHIPMYSNYFIIPSKLCRPDPIEKQTEPNLEKCQIDVDFKNTIILRMPYGGVGMYDYNFDFKTFSPVQFTQHLLEACALLALNGVIHNDMHQGNILIDQNQVPRLIDFGRSLFSYEKTTEKDLLTPYSARYSQEPPDYFLLNSKINKINKDMAIKDFLEKRRDFINKMGGFFGKTSYEISQDMEEYTLSSTSYSSGDIVGWFEHHWRTIDAWAVGVRLVDCFFILSYFQDFNKIWENEGKIILPVLKRLVEINPFRRIDCVQALDMLDSLGDSPGENVIINSYAGNWLDKVGRVRL